MILCSIIVLWKRSKKKREIRELLYTRLHVYRKSSSILYYFNVKSYNIYEFILKLQSRSLSLEFEISLENIQCIQFSLLSEKKPQIWSNLSSDNYINFGLRDNCRFFWKCIIIAVNTLFLCNVYFSPFFILIYYLSNVKQSYWEIIHDV